MEDYVETLGQVDNSILVCQNCQHRYPVKKNIPRFVSNEHDLANFGFQWNLFRKTQLDSHSGLPISKNRFFAHSGWKPEELEGKLVLDVGCGAGRFTEIALSCGAKVVAVDFSRSVEACWENMPYHPNLEVVQADIFHLPFAPETFDFIYCFWSVTTYTQSEGSVQYLTCAAQANGKTGGGYLPKAIPQSSLAEILGTSYYQTAFTRTSFSNCSVYRQSPSSDQFTCGTHPIDWSQIEVYNPRRKLRRSIPTFTTPTAGVVYFRYF